MNRNDAWIWIGLDSVYIFFSSIERKTKKSQLVFDDFNAFNSITSENETIQVPI